MQDVQAKAAQIKLVVFDVDGVLTDGSLFLGDDGQEYKAFNSRDGHGMKLLQASGVEIGIITGRSSNVVKLRMESLGVRHVYQGRLDKLPAFEHLLQATGHRAEATAYVGDDVMDIPVLRAVGLAVAVQDAHAAVKQHAHWVTPSCGGRGAAREVCELLMQAQGSWEAQLGQYL